MFKLIVIVGIVGIVMIQYSDTLSLDNVQQTFSLNNTSEASSDQLVPSAYYGRWTGLDVDRQFSISQGDTHSPTLSPTLLHTNTTIRTLRIGDGFVQTSQCSDHFRSFYQRGHTHEDFCRADLHLLNDTLMIDGLGKFVKN